LKLSDSPLVGALALSIQWEQSSFYLQGTITDLEGTFIIEPSEAPKLHDLLNSLRKSHHLSICQEQDVEASDRFTGFSKFSFIPEALPDLNWDDLSLQTEFLGRTFEAPMLITGMTGGIERGQELNYRLATAAETFGIPMGIGSQRMALENPEYRKIFTVKDYAPNLFLIGNLGGSQLLSSNALELCKKSVEMVEADALAIHLNVIQECVQAEGSPQFRGLWKNLEQICNALGVPVLVKEVGSGISPLTAKRLVDAGVSAIDCGGRGGTSWGYIEGLRSVSEQTLDIAKSFRDWGIPTAYSLSAIRKELPYCQLVATGGIRDGLTLGKALALGANMVGLGLPLMRAASDSEDKLHSVMESFVRGLQTTMLATGSKDVSDLKTKIVRGVPYE
jgi:isopentenyl-diphosphate delta-isomerase